MKSPGGMDAERLKYARQDNCFVWLADYSRAQTLLTAQLEKHWPEWLNRIAQQLNPGIKHSFNGNSVKAYDKAFTVVGNVLRVEATIHRVERFKVYRSKQGGPEEDLSWLPLRRGVADLHRRAELSQKINERYLNALASLDDSSTLEQVSGCLEQPLRWKGRRVRGLHLWQSDDHRLLATIARGEFVLQGLRNRDLLAFLFRNPPESAKQARQRSAHVSRLLAILRAHGLIQKLPKTHRYQVTSTGRKVLTAILAASHATIAQLTKGA